MEHHEQMNIVVVGHVDHGKSTVIGRLLADTGSLPQGKLEQVKSQCERNARPFEYAFLLDALKDEQAQGITIDTARCFFKTKKRDYIIIDAPGHVEFLKNMVSGAARAEAALLVIDAHEGIAENSRRHGYLVSMLGIRQLVVLVNKMDLVGYCRNVFDAVAAEYRGFLRKLDMAPVAFIPMCARDGDNLAFRSSAMNWYDGPTVLNLVDDLENKADSLHKPLRMPVQDIYKFTEDNDNRRIFAGTIESGSVTVGDEVVFLPSGKQSKIVTIEGFNTPPGTSVECGRSTGFTLRDELYLKRGEIMCKSGEPLPVAAARFRANVFWMGTAPLVKDKKYRLKIGTARTTVRLLTVTSCIDASDLSGQTAVAQVNRHEVAECIFETVKPVAFDAVADNEATGRFVIVDGYDIAGGGIILGAEETAPSWLGVHVRSREAGWERGGVTPEARTQRNGHCGKTLIIIGDDRRTPVAHSLEKALFDAGFQCYFTAPGNLRIGLDAEASALDDAESERIFHLGETARILTDAGMIFITVLDEADHEDLAALRRLNQPFEAMVVSLGSGQNSDADTAIASEEGIDSCVTKIVDLLRSERVLPEYAI